MFEKFKQLFTKKHVTPDWNVDMDCMFAISITTDDIPKIAFNITNGREFDFINMFCMLHQGKLYDMCIEYIRQIGTANNIADDVERIIHAIETTKMHNTYNGAIVPVEEEDPIICPTIVFKGGEQHVPE